MLGSLKSWLGARRVTYDVGSSRPRHLERHDRQRHEAGHLMMMMIIFKLTKSFLVIQQKGLWNFEI